MAGVGDSACVRVGVEQPKDAGLLCVIEVHASEPLVQFASNVREAERQESLEEAPRDVRYAVVVFERVDVGAVGLVVYPLE